ncbi:MULTISPECIES: FecR family protein [unclassified Caulobacter]|jgi:transmembrane sensor|uniref:FecR family protein n=1 Tax=unclassified Caulobacter TaxID=2648921 RepID=UPI0007821BF3|nr:MULTISPECIES: FecR family protein [unclassified Caulobacter]AZS21751.1 FecR family protein [Caulobacter sp. FWC26]
MIDQTHRSTDTEQEAADWYARLNSTVIESSDVTAFEAWRKIPDNRQAYDRLSAAASRLRALRGDPALEDLADDALARAAKSRTGRRMVSKSAGVGAGLLLAAGLVVGAVSLNNAMGRRYESAVGERKTVQLSDGSAVLLNTNSRIAVRLTKDRRLVKLVRGQAMFDVAHDKTRPFVVTAGSTSITAIGTRFDVYRQSDAVQVTLAEGKVAVRDQGRETKAWTLSPGQKIVVGPAAAKPSRTDVAADTSWTAGQIVFHNAPLDAAVAEVNRYSARKVVLAEGAPHNLEINGTFPTGDVDGFAMAASNILDLETHTASGGKTIELRPRGAPSP